MYVKADPFKKVFGKDLTTEVKKRVLAEASNLFRQLLDNSLRVSLIPAPDPQFIGHMIRFVDERNPKWYREIYSELDVKRDRIIESLSRIVQSKPSNMSSYDYMFIDKIKDRLLNRYDEEEQWVYHDNDVRAFMGLEPIEITEEVVTVNKDIVGF